MTGSRGRAHVEHSCSLVACLLWCDKCMPNALTRCSFSVLLACSSSKCLLAWFKSACCSAYAITVSSQHVCSVVSGTTSGCIVSNAVTTCCLGGCTSGTRPAQTDSEALGCSCCYLQATPEHAVEAVHNITSARHVA